MHGSLIISWPDQDKFSHLPSLLHPIPSLLAAFDSTIFQQSNKPSITKTACTAGRGVAEFVHPEKHKSALFATLRRVIVDSEKHQSKILVF